MQRRTIGVVWNASKGRRRVDEFVAGTRARAPATEVRVYATRAAGDAEAQAARALADGADVLVAAGGDGTLLAVLQACVPHRRPLSCVPLGVSNDFARMLGISGVADAISAVCGDSVRAIDVGEAHYTDLAGRPARRYFCSTAGVGAMARVFEYERRPLSRRLKRLLGDAIWPLLTLRSFVSSPVVRAELRLGEVVSEVVLSTLELSKVTASGGMCFTPDADIVNGRLDAWTFHSRGLLDFLAFTRRLLRGDRSHLSLPFVGYHAAAERLRRVEVRPAQPMLVHLNGELVGTTPARFVLTDFTVPTLAPPRGTP